MPREYTVLVTGFGANFNKPYGNDTSNPAGTVAHMMPASLPADHALNKTGATITFLDPVAGKFGAIEATTAIVRQRIRELHAEHGAKVDLWIHLGRGPWDFVSCERLAFRQDFTSSWLSEEAHKGYYLGRDNEGKSAHDLGPHPWAAVPMGLMTEIDVDAAVAGATENLSKHCASTPGASKAPLEVRSHLEAGAAGCGHCYYESMANCFVAGRRRDVLFCHLPRYEEKDRLEMGRDAILAVVGAALVAKQRREEGPLGDWKQEFGKVR